MTAFCRHAVLPIVLNDVPAPVQQRYLAHSPVEVMAEYPIQTVIQLLKTKEAGTSKPAPAEFSFRRSKFDVPALYFTSAKKDVLYVLFSWPTYMGV